MGINRAKLWVLANSKVTLRNTRKEMTQELREGAEMRQQHERGNGLSSVWEWGEGC